MSEDIPDLPPSPINDGITPVGEMDEFGEEQSSSDIADFDLELVEDGGYSGASGDAPFQERMTVYKYQDKRYGVPQRWYWGNIVKRMINHNKAHGYTGCVLIGMSGSGKTTLTNTILHKLHDYGENYIYKWFNGKQMIELDKHIKDLQVGVPHVMIFDDASYTLEDASKNDIAKLANALTTIRHHVKSRVITIFNIHYSRATKKFFRNQHFTFLTSVTTEELGNLKDLFQDKMYPVRQFAKKYRQMALLGHFYVPVSFYDGKSAKYKINEPFRVGMVSEITDLHFFLYPRQSCEICRPGKPPKFEEKTVDEVVEMLKKYKNQSSLLTTLGFWIKLHNIGPDPLENAYKSYWRFFERLSKDVKVPWDKVHAKLKEGKRRRGKKGRQLKTAKDVFVEALAEEAGTKKTDYELQKEREAIQTEDPDNYGTEHERGGAVKDNFPDYDSTYIAPDDDS